MGRSDGTYDSKNGTSDIKARKQREDAQAGERQAKASHLTRLSSPTSPTNAADRFDPVSGATSELVGKFRSALHEVVAEICGGAAGLVDQEGPCDF
jgi:hypothetical protein